MPCKGGAGHGTAKAQQLTAERGATNDQLLNTGGYTVSRYAWRITKDLIDDGKAIGTEGPQNAPNTMLAIVRQLEKDPSMANELPKATRFRMLDDDGEVYFEGFLYGDNVDLFEPLDDFGMPGYGCTSIETMQDGQWVKV